VLLKDRQDANKLLDKQKKVLAVSGLVDSGQKLDPKQVTDLFEKRIVAKVVDLTSGEYVSADEVDPSTYDQIRASKDPALSRGLESNRAKVRRMPNRALVYQVVGEGGGVEQLILPIEGYGLWGTLYGFLAIDKDANTVKGITYYQHKETPGLGGEVDNPIWKARWSGRKLFDESGRVALAVIKGAAGTIEETPHKIDGLSGATITGNGVTNMIALWFSDEAFGPYLKKFRETGA
jgi:Na+-transporting NADH:ubiquinone oxidoreductase subunit C